MGAHAKLSASASKRWLLCPPSVRLGEGFKEEPSPYAQEGTEAHALCEHKLKLALGLESSDPIPGFKFYNDEMEGCCEWYKDYVLLLLDEAHNTCPDAKLFIEQKLDLTSFIPDGFGTADAIIASDGTMFIVDFKMGAGVKVDVEQNTQLMCYALGALDTFGNLYNVDTVSLHIFQPRRDNICDWSISVKDLMQWANEVLIPGAKLAHAGEGDFKAGDHCRFCRAKALCRARAEYNLSLAQYDFGMPETLTEIEVEAVLQKADQVSSWVEDIKKYALATAASGKKWPGFKLVAGRSNRRFTDEAAVAKAVIEAGFEPYERKLLSVTALTNIMGKAKFNEVLAGLIDKPPGKPTLVPESDKRKALDTAKNDFM